MTNRRKFLQGAGAALAMGSGLVARSALAALPEAPSMQLTNMQPPIEPDTGPWFNGVVTLNS